MNPMNELTKFQEENLCLWCKFWDRERGECSNVTLEIIRGECISFLRVEEEGREREARK